MGKRRRFEWKVFKSVIAKDEGKKKKGPSLERRHGGATGTLQVKVKVQNRSKGERQKRLWKKGSTHILRKTEKAPRGSHFWVKKREKVSSGRA